MRRDNSFLIIVVLLVIFGAGSAALYFRPVKESDTVRANTLPMEIGGWKGEDIELTDRTYAVLETKNVVMRKYTNEKGQAVYLYIVISENNRKVAHPPEICYIGAGSKIIEKNVVGFQITDQEKSFKVNRFVSMDRGESLVYYWFRSGDRFTENYIHQQIRAAWNRLTGKSAVIGMVRISSPVTAGDKKSTDNLLQEFTREIIPSLNI